MRLSGLVLRVVQLMGLGLKFYSKPGRRLWLEEYEDEGAALCSSCRACRFVHSKA